MTSDINLTALQSLASNPSPEARTDFAGGIGELFLQRADSLQPRERGLIHEILLKLVRDTETAVRQRLAERLAPAAHVPSDLILALAYDAPEVAEPVLLHSPVLRDPDLIAVIRARTRQHRLAVARREGVSEAVGDALVATDDPVVMVALLTNPASSLSVDAAEKLAERAKTVEQLQAPLVSRRDLGAEIARRLYWYVSAALREAILERHDIDAADLDAALEDAVHDLAAGDNGCPHAAERHDAAAAELADRIAAARGIDAPMVLKALRCGDRTLFEALMSRFSGIARPRLRRLIEEKNGRGLAVIARALGMTKPDFVPLYLLSRTSEAASADKGSDALWQVLELFDTIPRDSACRLLETWRREGGPSGKDPTSE